MPSTAPTVSDLLVTTKSREIQRGMQAELRGDADAASRHLMAAAHLELVLADDYAEAGDPAMSARALISAGSCFWRGGDPNRGREILEAVIQDYPDQTDDAVSIIADLESSTD